MTTHERADLVRSSTTDDPCCRVIEALGVVQTFVATVPRNDGTLQDQVRDALKGTREVIDREGGPAELVAQTVFLRDAKHLQECETLLQEHHGDQIPAITYLLQPPCCGKLVAIESMGLGSGSEQVEIERVNQQMVIARHGGISWFHCANIVPQTDAPLVHQRSIDTFERMRQMFSDQGIGFGNVIRTWLYLGDIVGDEGEVQRYTELNRARTDFFEDIRFGAGLIPRGFDGPIYPASTGIGICNHDLVISGVAIDGPADNVTLLPLENPHQTSACDYSENYSPRSPKFARAMAVARGEQSMIFLSGTASITHSESRFQDDSELQTQQTLDNMEALISKENFARYDCAAWGATLGDLAVARVYIKHQRDYHKIRRICESRWGSNLPVLYTVADICRSELLVEIEAIAFSANS